MSMMAKIREEGLNHSQVMEIVFNLTDANGPRLMQSPGYFKAANWAKTELGILGTENAKLEAWGKWGKGWELEKYYLAMTAPYYEPLIGFPKTFSKGTNGLKHAQVVLIDVKDSSGLAAYQGKLKNKIVLLKRNGLSCWVLSRMPPDTQILNLLKWPLLIRKLRVTRTINFSAFAAAARFLPQR